MKTFFKTLLLFATLTTSCSDFFDEDSNVNTEEGTNNGLQNEIEETLQEFLALTEINVSEGKIFEIEGFSTVLETHQQWFEKVTAMPEGTSRDYYLTWVRCFQSARYLGPNGYHESLIGDVLVKVEGFYPGVMEEYSKCAEAQPSLESSQSLSLTDGIVEKIQQIDATEVIESALQAVSNFFIAPVNAQDIVAKSAHFQMPKCFRIDSCEEAHSLAAKGQCTISPFRALNNPKINRPGWPLYMKVDTGFSTVKLPVIGTNFCSKPYTLDQ